jgi:hypothetical protein
MEECLIMSKLKDFPGSDGLHVGEMAIELAEHVALSMPIQELLAVAQEAINEKWLQHAQEAPEEVVRAYKSLMGVDDNEM